MRCSFVRLIIEQVKAPEGFVFVAVLYMILRGNRTKYVSFQCDSRLCISLLDYIRVYVTRLSELTETRG